MKKGFRDISPSVRSYESYDTLVVADAIRVYSRLTYKTFKASWRRMGLPECSSFK